MDENKNEISPDSQDISGDFKDPVTKSDQITSKNNGDEKHNETKKKFNPVLSVLTAILGMCGALFHFIKKRIKPRYLIAILLIVVTVSLALISYFVFFKGGNITPDEPSQVSVEDYVKKIAIYDFEGVKNIEIIETEKLVELVEGVDFEQFCENRISSQTEILGNNPKIEINDIKTGKIDSVDGNILGYFLNHELKMQFTEKDIGEGKSATVSVTKTGNGQSVTEKYTLFLLKVKNGDGSEWKIINSAYIDTYARNNGISVPEENDFAKSGDGYFDE